LGDGGVPGRKLSRYRGKEGAINRHPIQSEDPPQRSHEVLVPLLKNDLSRKTPEKKMVSWGLEGETGRKKPRERALFLLLLERTCEKKKKKFFSI